MVEALDTLNPETGDEQAEAEAEVEQDCALAAADRGGGCPRGNRCGFSGGQVCRILAG
jgi:hypothetical protein